MPTTTYSVDVRPGTTLHTHDPVVAEEFAREGHRVTAVTH